MGEAGPRPMLKRTPGKDGVPAAMRGSQAEAINMPLLADPAQAATAPHPRPPTGINPKGGMAIRMHTATMPIPATPCHQLFSRLTFTAANLASFRRSKGHRARKACLLKRRLPSKHLALPATAHSLTSRPRLQPTGTAARLHGKHQALPSTVHRPTSKLRVQHTGTAAATPAQCMEGRALLRAPREHTRQVMASTEYRTGLASRVCTDGRWDKGRKLCGVPSATKHPKQDEGKSNGFSSGQRREKENA